MWSMQTVIYNGSEVEIKMLNIRFNCKVIIFFQSNENTVLHLL